MLTHFFLYRPNLKLYVESRPGLKFEQELQWYIEQLKLKGSQAPKEIIYSRHISTVSAIYIYIMSKLCMQRAYMLDDPKETPKAAQ